jgi:hypothetical protein
VRIAVKIIPPFYSSITVILHKRSLMSARKSSCGSSITEEFAHAAENQYIPIEVDIDTYDDPADGS